MTHIESKNNVNRNNSLIGEKFSYWESIRIIIYLRLNKNVFYVTFSYTQWRNEDESSL